MGFVSGANIGFVEGGKSGFVEGGRIPLASWESPFVAGGGIGLVDTKTGAKGLVFRCGFTGVCPLLAAPRSTSQVTINNPRFVSMPLRRATWIPRL